MKKMFDGNELGSGVINQGSQSNIRRRKKPNTAISWLGDDTDYNAFQTGFIGKMERFFHKPDRTIKRWVAPASAGIGGGETIIRAIAEDLRAWPSIAKSDLADYFETIASGSFRAGYMMIHVLDNVFNEPRILHVPRRILDAIIPGAITNRLLLQLVGIFVRRFALGNRPKSDKTEIDNDTGTAIAISVAFGAGVCVWLFNTGAIGQLSKKYPSAEGALNFGKFVFFTMGNTLILIAGSNLVITGLAQIFSSIPQEPENRVELMQYVYSWVWSLCFLTSVISGWLQAFGFRGIQFRLALTPLFIQLCAPAVFITEAIMKCYAGGIPVETVIADLCIFNMVSLGITLSPAIIGITLRCLRALTPILSCVLTSLSISRAGYEDISFRETMAINMPVEGALQDGSLQNFGREITGYSSMDEGKPQDGSLQYIGRENTGYSSMDDGYLSAKERAFDEQLRRIQYEKRSHKQSYKELTCWAALHCCCPGEEKTERVEKERFGNVDGEVSDDLETTTDDESSFARAGTNGLGYYGEEDRTGAEENRGLSFN